MAKSLQDTYSPNGICFGCGPRNPEGLRLKSFPEADSVVADWTPKPYHAAFAGFASGGVVSVLMDCHGNWTGTYALMKSRGLDSPPGTVTAELTVRFLKPTPIREPWHLTAWAEKVGENRVTVRGALEVSGSRTVEMSGLFVAVKEDHPAFHRWQ